MSNGVIRIGSNAFYQCDNLRYVFYKGSEKEWKAIDGSTGPYSSSLKNAKTVYNFKGIPISGTDVHSVLVLQL